MSKIYNEHYERLYDFQIELHNRCGGYVEIDGDIDHNEFVADFDVEWDYGIDKLVPFLFENNGIEWIETTLTKLFNELLDVDFTIEIDTGIQSDNNRDEYDAYAYMWINVKYVNRLK